MATRMCGGEPAVRKGPWTLEEDLILVSYISEHGEGSWDNLARAAGLNRNGKSCRLRWLNYLRPGVRRGSITPAEDALIRELQATMGNKWSKIAKHLPGRTDNEIKNYWRTRIQKRPPATTTAQQQPRRQPNTMTTISEGASSSSALASQESSSGGDGWYTQASYPYHSSGLSSAADHLGVVGVDSSPTTQFFSSDFSDSFWNAVNNFWETIPVKDAF